MLVPMKGGTRCRVWVTDDEVTVDGTRVAWEHHQGVLSRNMDTTLVVKEEPGERSTWRFVRDRSADSLLAALHGCAGRSYVYRKPETLGDGWACDCDVQATLPPEEICTRSEER